MRLGKTAIDYITRVCRGIRSRADREDFCAELADHMEEKVSALMRDRGMSQQQAEAEAVSCMGDATTIAEGMNRVHNDRAWTILKYVFLGITFFLGFEMFIAPYLWLLSPALAGLSIEWFSPYLAGAEGMGVIGGADGPTAIYMTSKFNFPAPLLFYLFLGLTIFLFVFPYLRRARKRRMK